MARIHAISDIHGHIGAFTRIVDALKLQANTDDRLILLGDYIDRGADSAQCLYLAKELSSSFRERVVVLLGNHETDFLDWLDSGPEAVDWMLADRNLSTIRSFVSHDDLLTIVEDLAGSGGLASVEKANAAIQTLVREKHRELLSWLRSCPLYYDTPEQIFVHAGVDEDCGRDWELYTPKSVFTERFPAQFGRFYKTIIAGHIGTETMHGDGSHTPYFDGYSHWYIDGSVEKTGKLNVLTYDTATLEYSHFNGPLRNYVLVDQGLGVPEAYVVQLGGENVGYMRERRGYARAEYRGATIWEHGETGGNSAGYMHWVNGQQVATPLLWEALHEIDEAHCKQDPSAATHGVYTIDFVLKAYDHSSDS